MRALPLLFLLTGCAAAAQQLPPPTGLTPEDVARLQHVRTAAISPEGERIAYTVSLPRHPGREEDGAARTALYVVDARGESRRYTPPSSSVQSVDFSPDGRHLYFLAHSQVLEQRTLHRMPVDGGGPVPVLAPPTPVEGYAVAPDGKQVAWIGPEPVDEDRKTLQDKGLDVEVYEEQLRSHRLWVGELAPLPGAWERDPETEPPEPLPIAEHVSAVQWSPDATRLLVVVAPTPLVDDDLMRRKLRLIDPSTGDTALEFAHEAKLGAVRWSPDGSQLAAIVGEDLHDPREGRIYVFNAATGEARDLLPDWEGHAVDLAWQDEDTLVYIGAEGCERVLGEVDLDGSRRQLIGPGEAIWHGLDAAERSSALALIGDTPRHPREIYRYEDGATRLTHHNPWLEDIPWMPQEVIRWKARDGLEIEGVLVKPAEIPEGERIPLVLTVHGGPESHVPNGFVTTYHRPGQMGAARGYAVLYPNYRGSTGRGVEFSKLDQGDYAGAEFNDLVDGIAHLDAEGWIDPDRVGITGWSYGGYATAWASTRLTEHFAAGVMGVGISEQISKFGTTDIPFEMYSVHARSWPWEDWDFFRERSPVTYATQASTPLLIAHGKEDTRVHPSQSMTMYRYLKQAGQAPVRLLLYPGEGHGNRDAASRYDFSLRMLRWFDHYLLGEGGEPPPWELSYGLEISPAEDGHEAADADAP